MQPPPDPDSLNEPLYEAFYGLREQPFSLATDPRFLYLSPSHRLAFDELLTGLRRHEGLLLLTGDTGTGKTTLCRAVIDSLGHRSFSALILNPYMSDAEVLRTILRDFGLVTRDEIRTGAFAHADVPQLLDTLEAFLRSLVPLNSYAVVIIDEAQSLSPRVLDQIRVLGSMELDGRRLLEIVLVGQPALIDTLRGDAMRALADRISRRISLGSLPERDVDAYVRHRLAIAGGKDAVAFDADAIARITDVSDGLPRRINLLCDRALELGRVAGVTTITAEMISKAARAIAGAAPAAEPERGMVRRNAPPALPRAERPADGSLKRPISDDSLNDLALSMDGPDGPAEPDGHAPERGIDLFAEPPRAKSSLWFWMVLLVLAGAASAATYFAVRWHWISF